MFGLRVVLVHWLATVFSSSNSDKNNNKKQASLKPVLIIPSTEQSYWWSHILNGLNARVQCEGNMKCSGVALSLLEMGLSLHRPWRLATDSYMVHRQAGLISFFSASVHLEWINISIAYPLSHCAPFVHSVSIFFLHFNVAFPSLHLLNSSVT